MDEEGSYQTEYTKGDREKRGSQVFKGTYCTFFAAPPALRLHCMLGDDN
jgi:hypothetical protein